MAMAISGPVGLAKEAIGVTAGEVGSYSSLVYKQAAYDGLL